MVLVRFGGNNGYICHLIQKINREGIQSASPTLYLYDREREHTNSK